MRWKRADAYYIVFFFYISAFSTWMIDRISHTVSHDFSFILYYFETSNYINLLFTLNRIHALVLMDMIGSE